MTFNKQKQKSKNDFLTLLQIKLHHDDEVGNHCIDDIKHQRKVQFVHSKQIHLRLREGHLKGEDFDLKETKF